MNDDHSQRAETRTELLNSIIPDLVAEGYLEWDPTTERLRRGPRFDELEPILEEMDGPDDFPFDREP